MIWIITRKKLFLDNVTFYHFTITLDNLKFCKSTLNRCKTLLKKIMYEFRDLSTVNTELLDASRLNQAHNSFGRNESNCQKVKSEGNIYRNISPEPLCIQPQISYGHHFPMQTNTIMRECFTSDISVFSTHLGPTSPHLMCIPLPPVPVSSSGGPVPAMPQNILLPQNVQCNQNRYYLRRSHSSGSFPTGNVDEVSEILKVLSKRRWQDAPIKRKSSRKPSKPRFEFTLMSYNVLAQQLLTEHPYLYRRHNPKALDWKTRWKNLFNEIKTMKPDILCLQEVQESHLSGYYNKLKSIGYEGIYKKRTGIRCDGCAIYYKPDKLTLVEYETVEFFQPNVPVLNRDNIAIIAKLCPKHSPTRHFLVATTHLLYNPKRQDVRLAQTQLLLTEVERMSFHWNSKGNEKYWPMIITGDFNSTPDSVIYDFITKGVLKYDHLAARRMHKPDSPKHGNILVPSCLEITDFCQHACLVERRKNKEDVSRTKEAALIKLHNSDKSVTKVSSESVKNPELFCSGTLTHSFALKSVYDHGDPSNPPATTFQDEWITVDYIFYSGKKRDDQIDDHKLKLMSSYRLPLRDELGSMKIPNSLIGSDHLSLTAKFSMTI